MAIRITTLSLMTPWDKELADLEELVEHLKRIGYVRPTIHYSPSGLTAANGVAMTVQDLGTAEHGYVMSQDCGEYTRRHRIEVYDYVTAVSFEDMCHDEWGVK